MSLVNGVPQAGRSPDTEPVPPIPAEFDSQSGHETPLAFPGLDALSTHVAIVDQRGDIRWVNQAWRDFAAAFVSADQRPAEGANYFEVCASMIPADAPALTLGIQAVASGEQPLFTHECAWQSPAGALWFSVRATRLPLEGRPLALVVHENITGRKLAETQALELAREQAARAEAEALQLRLAFLANASALLAGSLDYETTLARIPSLAVPQLADWCSVHLVSGEAQVTPVAYLHRDPAMTDALRPLVYEYPPNLAWERHPIAVALRTRQPQLLAQIPDSWAESVATDARHLELLQLLHQTSMMILPLVAREQLLGVLILSMTRPGHHYGAADLVLAEELATRAALAIDNARLYTSARRAHRVALMAASRVSRLQTVTAALSSARLPEQVAGVIVHHALEVIGAGAGFVALLGEDGQTLTTIASAGYSDAVQEHHAALSLHDHGPLQEAVSTGEPVWVNSPDEWEGGYPHHAHAGFTETFQSWVTLPLVVEGQVLGVCGCAFTQLPEIDEEHRLFLRILVDQCAQAMQRALLYREAEQSRAAAEAAQQQAALRAQRMEALAEASQSFAEVLHDPATALEHITRYISELLGDLCVVRLLGEDGDGLTSIAMHHPDPAALRMLRAVSPARMPARASRLHGPVVASGQPRLFQQHSLEEMYALSSPLFRRFYDKYGIFNVFVVPLRARGRVIGTMAAFRHARKPIFSLEEQAFLEALAGRAALAVENASLYREAQFQRARLQAVLDQIPEPVVLGRVEDGHTLEVNHAAEQFAAQFGGTGAAVWGQLAYASADGKPVAYADLPMTRAARGEVVVGSEIRITAPSGVSCVVLANAAPVRDDRGQITSAVLVFQDITDRKTLEQQKDDFMSLVAHELRTPLTVLIGHAQLMARRLQNLQPHRDAIRERTGVNADRVADSLQDILDGAQDMARLINELLDLSRIETGKLELNPQPADLMELLKKVLERHRHLHPNRFFGLDGGDAPLWGVWDAGRLEQVFTNLLENAAKYSSSGRPVVARVAADEREVQVQVQDWGIGIPADDLPHIFDRHFRAGNVGRVTVGLGLGLYLTKQLVERHGGTLTVESAEGEGSTFTVTLPLEGSRLQPPAHAADGSMGAAEKQEQEERAGDGSPRPARQRAARTEKE